MPTYEYHCAHCDKTIDVIQRLSDALLRNCPVCDSQEIKRCISLPAVITKSKSLTIGVRGEPGVSVGSVPPDFRHPNFRARQVVV